MEQPDHVGEWDRKRPEKASSGQGERKAGISSEQQGGRGRGAATHNAPERLGSVFTRHDMDNESTPLA